MVYCGERRTARARAQHELNDDGKDTDVHNDDGDEDVASHTVHHPLAADTLHARFHDPVDGVCVYGRVRVYANVNLLECIRV